MKCIFSRIRAILLVLFSSSTTICAATIYADVDLSRVVDVIREMPANNDFVLPSDSRFERKWQNFMRAAKGNVRHNIGDAFVLIDTTIMGACDEGVLIDRLGITVQHDFSDGNGFIPWAAFVENGTVSQEDIFGDELILFVNPKIAAHFEKSDFKIDNARSFFDSLLIAIRNSPNSSSTSTEQHSRETSQVNIQDFVFNKRIEKFGGYYLGGKIKLPDHCKNYGIPGYENYFDHFVECLDGCNYKYDKKSNSIIQHTSLPSQNDGCSVGRDTAITPRTRLVKVVRLFLTSKTKSLLMKRVKTELHEAIGLPLFLEEGQLKADKGRQLITFETTKDTYKGEEYFGSYVSVIDYGSIDAEKAYVQAQKDKQQKELQRWIDDFNSRPPFTSFCGIEFGTRLTGDLERTENGRYLCGYVELDTPFRGCDTAKVYAGVKTHRIFRVEIETKDPPGALSGHSYAYNYDEKSVLAKRYKPNGNPLIKFDSYLAKFEGDKWREEVRLRKLLWDSGYSCEGYNLNGGKINVQSRNVGTGDFYNTVEEHGNYALAVTKERETEVGVLIATSYKYERLANKEYEEESGGDGSGVL